MSKTDYIITTGGGHKYARYGNSNGKNITWESSREYEYK
jgi:hypothetical protein